MIFRNICRGCGRLWWSCPGGRGSAGTVENYTLHELQTRCIRYWRGATAAPPKLAVLPVTSTRFASKRNHAPRYAPSCCAAHGTALPTKYKPGVKSDAADKLREECSYEDAFTDDSFWEDRKDVRIKSSNKKVTVSEKVIQRMNSLFNLNCDEALLTFQSCDFQQLPEEVILNTMHFLKDHNITSQQIQRIPWILLHSEDSLREKFSKLTEPHLFRNCSEGLGFCYFPLQQITAYQRSFKSEAADFPNHNNRVYYIAEKLKVPVECLSEKIVKPRRILSLKMKSIEHKIDIFHRYGIHSEDILADLWVFTYSAKKAEERLQHATEIGCKVLKPWMCRCSSHIFDRFCERYHTGKLLYNEHKDMKGYLSEKLQCEPELVDKFLQSNSLLKKVHIMKFERLIELFYSEGLTPQEVRSCMRVFQYSEKRTAARISTLKQIGYFPFPLIIMCKTPKQFRNFVARYKNLHGFQIEDKDTL